MSTANTPAPMSKGAAFAIAASPLAIYGAGHFAPWYVTVPAVAAAAVFSAVKPQEALGVLKTYGRSLKTAFGISASAAKDAGAKIHTELYKGPTDKGPKAP